MSERGAYIVIEGMDATGKSLQVDRLHAHLGSLGIRSIQIHEPDGFVGDAELDLPAVPVATELRKIIKNGHLERDGHTNLMLFTAARRENWRQAMEPALAKGISVVSARNWLSSIAYQGYGEGLSVDDIAKTTLREVGEKYAHPDLTVLLTLTDEATRHERINDRGALAEPDTFESKPADFQQRVSRGYLEYTDSLDGNIPVINAAGTPESVEAEIWKYVQPLISD